jgi:hypothetical protein
MDSLKVLDPEGPIREADIGQLSVPWVSIASMCEIHPSAANTRPEIMRDHRAVGCPR